MTTNETNKKITNETNLRLIVDIIIKLSSTNKIVNMLLDIINLEPQYFEEHVVLSEYEQNNIVEQITLTYNTLLAALNRHNQTINELRNLKIKEILNEKDETKEVKDGD